MSNPTQGWPAGWYADPWFAGQQRWWDGAAWTPHVQAPVPAVTPPSAAPIPAVTPPSAAPVPAVTAPSAAPIPAVTAPSAAPAGVVTQPPDPARAADAPTPSWSPPDPYTPPAADPYTPPSADPYTPPAADPYTPPAADPYTPAAADPYTPPGARPADPYAPPWASGAGGAGGGWLAPDQSPTYPSVTPSTRRRWWVAVLAACVVVAVGAAAITVATGSGRRHRVVSGPATSPSGGGSASPSTIPPAVSNDPDASDLSRLDVLQADVAAGFSVTLLQGGNEVTGQVTLDLCNGTYASETLRTARRQVDLTDQAGKLWLSTEAVLYGNPADTAQAFTELKARAANCPTGFLPPPGGEDGLPPTKTTFNPVPDASWPATPGVERLAYDFTTTDQQANTERSIAVYLRRGRALLGVYFANPEGTQPSVAGKTSVEGIVGAFEQRLAALPASVVNATVAVTPPNGSI